MIALFSLSLRPTTYIQTFDGCKFCCIHSSSVIRKIFIFKISLAELKSHMYKLTTLYDSACENIHKTRLFILQCLSPSLFKVLKIYKLHEISYEILLISCLNNAPSKNAINIYIHISPIFSCQVMYIDD